MDTPTLPFHHKGKTIVYSVLVILWWVGIWGFADTIIHMVFKGETLLELGVYTLMIGLVLLIMYAHPKFLEQL